MPKSLWLRQKKGLKRKAMTKQETIQVLQSIEDRAIDFPNMTECDWVAIAAAKRHLTEEPVSEDLEEAIGQSFIYHENRGDDFRSDKQIETAYRYGFETGANWQAEQFEKNRLAACDAQAGEEAEIERDFVMSIIEKEHRQPTFDDAIKYGMRLKEKQMKASGTDVTVHIEAGNYPYIPQLELYDYDKDIPLAKEGDKYKVVLIKEE